MNTLWTIAQPQNTIPSPISALVTIAGVEWNCINVYNIRPEKIKHNVIQVVECKFSMINHKKLFCGVPPQNM